MFPAVSMDFLDHEDGIVGSVRDATQRRQLPSHQPYLFCLNFTLHSPLRSSYRSKCSHTFLNLICASFPSFSVCYPSPYWKCIRSPKRRRSRSGSRSRRSRHRRSRSRSRDRRRHSPRSRSQERRDREKERERRQKGLPQIKSETASGK